MTKAFVKMGLQMSLWLFISILLVECYDKLEMSPRIVFTKQGPVQGFLGPANVPGGYNQLPHYSSGGSTDFNMRHYNGRPLVEIFKGLPYSSPPLGPLLRYESPAPVQPRSRTEVFIANMSRPSCPRTSEEVFNRTSSPNSFLALKRTVDNSVEDCLYLEIYAPLNSIYYNAGDKSRGNGLAVLVYMNSHPDDPKNPFDGSSFAAIGNLIVVSVRYRTGVLGFLQPSYSEEVRANFGMWDQLAALQWIKENIIEFGGDSNNICLMGYDVDATVAGLLALSPVSQAYNGLFHRLILLNGSPFAPNAINPEPIRTTYQLARALSCPTDERSSGDLARCLRSMPVPRLVAAAEKNIGVPLMTYPFSPSADGIVVPHELNQPSPGNNPTVQEMLRKYDILCGLKEGPVLPKVGWSTLTNVDMERFVTAVIKLTIKMESGSEPTKDIKKAIANAIMNDNGYGYGTSPPMRELISDFLVVQPIIDLLNAHSKTGKNTFFYVFKDYDPLGLLKHDEISYIFSSNVYRWKYSGGTPSTNKNLHSFFTLINLLANFVKNGDPNILDPSDRYPPAKSWPKYSEGYGRYMEISDDVRFPSFYRKQSTDFWGKTFLGIIRSFANSSHDMVTTFPEFPPNLNDRNNYDDSRYNNRPTNELYPPHEEEETPSIILGGQSSIVLVGCLLLLLNFLCFLGLFYQKERLKKAEIQLRKRYIESQKAVNQNCDAVDADIECSSSFVQEIPVTNHTNRTHPAQNKKFPSSMPHYLLRDNMSETETENGFGPEFLARPNYDPRTKVNRWMQMQQQRLGMMPSQGDYNRPHPTNTLPAQRLPRVVDEPPYGHYGTYPGQRGGGGMENPYEESPSSSQAPRYHQASQPSPLIIGLDQLPPSSYHHPPLIPHPIPTQTPMQIQINSLQRDSQPPKAVPEGPVQFFPQLPYQEPFKPSTGSDIPYADSRATSPSIISAPAGFTRTNPPLLMMANNRHKEELIELDSNVPTPTNSTTPTTTKKNVGETPKGILVTPSAKRTSTLIVRDLDPQEEECEPKYVPVKVGTLTRTIAVDTDNDSTLGVADSVGDSSSLNNINNSSSISNSLARSNPSHVRVTFKENL